MERVQSVSPVLVVDDRNDAAAKRDKIRMGNIEATTVGHSNRKGLKGGTEPVPNRFQVQHGEPIQLSAQQVN